MRLLSADGRNSAGRVFPAPLGAAAAQGIHRGETSNEIKALPASEVKHSKLCVSEVDHRLSDYRLLLYIDIAAGSSQCTEQGCIPFCQKVPFNKAIKLSLYATLD